MVQISRLKKGLTVLSTVDNWYLLPIDKLGLVSHLTYRFRNGSKLTCRSKSTDINEAIAVQSGLEYPTSLCLFDERTDLDPFIVLDIGGNIGAFTTWMLMLNPSINIHVHVLEPHPGNASLLRKNMRLNNFADVYVHEMAVASKSGVALLDISTGFDSFNILRDSEEAVEVMAISIIDFLHFHKIDRVDLLKMDIEGSEFQVVANDFDKIAHKVKRVVIEFHGALDSRQVRKMLEEIEIYYHINIFQVHTGGGVVFGTRKI